MKILESFMVAPFKIVLNEKLYIRDPELTKLGVKIISHSIDMIDKLGFEQFTFKKLALEIQSTEASVYRYFENKQQLLIYLISWYWLWLNFNINFKTNNIKSSEERLKIIIKIISEAMIDTTSNQYDGMALHRIVISESSKVFLIKDVNINNEDYLFKEYKDLCNSIAELILKINPSYNYAHSIASTIIQASHSQIYFAEHFPPLTDFEMNKNDYSQLQAYLEHILFSAIQQHN